MAENEKGTEMNSISGSNNDLHAEPAYWKSFKQLYNNPEFIEASRHEFKEGVKDYFNPSELSGISRRKFLALVGASAALAGTGCTDYRDKGEIIPYIKKPDEIIPGKANYYAATVNNCSCGCGVLVKTREGRPVKVDGNPDHPVSLGKLCAQCQASILSLYDPERLKTPLKNGEEISWYQADTEIRSALFNTDGKEIAVITHRINSPTTIKAIEDFKKRYQNAKVYSYELFSDEIKNSAWNKCYGESNYPLIKWDEAKIILSLEGDFLGADDNHIENARLYAAGRNVDNPDKFNRLYVVEGNMSLTGMNADYRLRLRPDAQFEFMNNGSIAAVIHFGANPVYHLPGDYGYKDALKRVNVVITMTELENETSALSHYVLPVNHNFESWGDARTRSGFYSLQQPVINPIFDTRQKESILLTWIDGKPNVYTPEIYHNYLTENWEREIYPTLNAGSDFKNLWISALHDGIVLTSETGNVQQGNPPAAFQQERAPEVSGYAVLLKESYTLGDGSFANNGWLQELPHPVSKIVWDNYASISVKTAADLDLKNNDVVEINIENRKLNIPVFIQPGAADDTFTIELGYGREKTGTVGTGVGFNAGVLQTKDFKLSPWLYNNASINKTGEKYKLVTAQEHQAFDVELTKDAAKRRGIIREGKVSQFEKNPDFLHEGEAHELNTLYGQHLSTLTSGLKWGMAIDMNKCLGCGECVIACVAENNIPIVGKEQVDKGREMHWLRIDRYYSGPVEDPEVHNQPMLCQHCDHAPCENVCPVVATTHSDDGLNQMVYNRCVGTRYCSNNCPYKVRRFNYFNFRDHFNDNYQQSSIFNLLYNPEVTVRSRGVMEKCTFCIQRIMEAREDAGRQKKQLRGNDVTTACQDACNANAITFGDVNEGGSDVNKLRHHKLGYFVLEELNVRPNVTYLAKLRNTHSEENID
jgi:MoCo/4Fe-4S cofactor protein with predicted Tat translocation signal